MRFNNFLNKIRVPGIYVLILSLVLVVISGFSLVSYQIFHVEEPAQVFESYAANLRGGNYYEATKLVASDSRDQWNENFAALAKDESAQASLLQFLWKQSRWELVSQTALAEDHYTLRYMITAPDAATILRQVREDAEAGVIDMSDTAIVRAGVDPESTLLYYVEDYFDKFKDTVIQSEIVISFRLEGNSFNRAWHIEPTDDLQSLLAGNLPTAVQTVFARPLVLPKS